MRRLISLLLVLFVATTAMTPPAAACVEMARARATAAHDCCDGILSAPATDCCFVSQPVADRSITESRYLPAAAQVAIAILATAPWDRPPRTSGGPGTRAPADVVVPSVPIYLHHLALLI